MGRWTNLMLTTDPAQRLRLVLSWLALLFTVAGVAVMNYYARVGVAAAGPVEVWSWVTMGGALLLFALARGGWSLRLADPAMTVPQIAFSMCSMAVAYVLAGEGRGAVFPAVMVALIFGIFRLKGAQMAWICLLTVILFGLSMAWAVSSQPLIYRPAVEWGHLFMVSTMVPAVAVLAWRLNALQRRLRQQREDLSSALAQISELATCDELTGLPNRRFMQELMTRHQERAARIGREFCLALIDIDHFKQVNDRFGHAMGDTVLVTLTREMKAVMRGSDELGRWGGEEFIMLMPNSNAAEALVGVERLRRRVQAVSMACQGESLNVTVSAGIAQSRPDETIAQILERADQALYAAKAAGRNRTVQADEILEPALPQTALSPAPIAPPLQ